MKIYGPVEKRIELEPHLTWATPGQRGFPKRSAASMSAGPPPPSQRPQVSRVEDAQNAVELRQIIDNLEKVDDDGRRSSLLDSLCSNEDILNLPLHPSPPSIESGELLTNLLKHQVRLVQTLKSHGSTKIVSGIAVVHWTRISCSPKERDRQTGAILAITKTW